ncbi:hypothetical protein V8V91_00800 [Algoriphagus halophilus]|uniref:hypothetical protein n=1 Tax=Algoriphagus halophilus TaxID=226505 RepID=UPI00358E7C16
MKNLKTTIFRMGFAFGLTLISGMSYSQDNPLAKYLEVPGAKVTMPINFAKSPFSLRIFSAGIKEL